LRSEPPISNRVSIRLPSCEVVTTINLDYERSVVANKIKHVSSKRYLAAETEPTESVCSQRIPKLALHGGHRSPKGSSPAFFGF
jgi:hypothetical protein